MSAIKCVRLCGQRCFNGCFFSMFLLLHYKFYAFYRKNLVKTKQYVSVYFLKRNKHWVHGWRFQRVYFFYRKRFWLANHVFLTQLTAIGNQSCPIDNNMGKLWKPWINKSSLSRGQRSYSWPLTDPWLQTALGGNNTFYRPKRSQIDWLPLSFDGSGPILFSLSLLPHFLLSLPSTHNLTFYHLSLKQRPSAIRHYSTRWQLLTHAWIFTFDSIQGLTLL